MKSILLGALTLLLCSHLHAESALTVDYNALWSVDLQTHKGQLLEELDSENPRFSCHKLAISASGNVLCARRQELFEIESGSQRRSMSNNRSAEKMELAEPVSSRTFSRSSRRFR